MINPYHVNYPLNSKEILTGEITLIITASTYINDLRDDRFRFRSLYSTHTH